MLATILNGPWPRQIALEASTVRLRLLTAIRISRSAEPSSSRRAIRHLYTVAVSSSWPSAPQPVRDETDTAAIPRARSWPRNGLLKATKVTASTRTNPEINPQRRRPHTRIDARAGAAKKSPGDDVRRHRTVQGGQAATPVVHSQEGNIEKAPPPAYRHPRGMSLAPLSPVSGRGLGEVVKRLCKCNAPSPPAPLPPHYSGG